MGKGGQSDVKVPDSKKYKLQHFADEELRKWAKAYALSDDGDRETLLKSLVRHKINFSILFGRHFECPIHV